MYKTNNTGMERINYPKNLKTLLIRCIEFNLIEHSYLKPNSLEVKCFRRFFVPELMKLINDYGQDKSNLTNDRLLVEYINQSLFVRGLKN